MRITEPNYYRYYKRLGLFTKLATSYYIYPYSRMINRMLWGHILSVAPETSTMEGGARFHFDTSHNRPDPFVARCDHTAPRGV